MIQDTLDIFTADSDCESADSVVNTRTLNNVIE